MCTFIPKKMKSYFAKTDKCIVIMLKIMFLLCISIYISLGCFD